ncbi:TraR/DksA C4-type zinc finger protein [Salipaludibacillus keqinensis]|nr:TraR/DksA C4-type zinc finger protein [Salipaludibacillus keqinensis]
MKKSQIDQLHKLLLDVKKDYEETLNKTDSDQDNSIETDELSHATNHPGDHGTELFERQRDLAIDQNTANKLEEVNDALTLIDEGKYGICQECGNEIPFERLELIPMTAYCVDHAQENSRSQKRPVEESVTSPLDPNNTSYKEELRQDSWEKIDDHGTSDSPADRFDTKENY